MMDGAAEDQHSVKGCYVLVVVSEPVSEDHKQLILQRLNKGFFSWDVEATGCDLTGLQNVCANVKDNGDSHDSDVLIQYSTESLGVEVLVNPPVSTLKQCMKNLLASSIGHKHLVYSGYTFAGSGSWILQNGTFSFNDFQNAFQDAEVHKHKGSTIHVHCIEEGEWNNNNLAKEAFSKVAKVSLNPSDRIDCLPGAEHLIDCLNSVLNSHSLDEIMEPSPLVGNVRFNSPTLYLFPAGDGDCSLFGVNGFNMLVDGGFSRKPCSWEFIRHLDRVDAVLVTRLNENNLCGLSTLMKRKSINNSSPEVGYVFCNIAEDGAPSPVSSEEFQKDRNDLLVSIVGEGHKFIHTLNELNLKPHQCWRAGTAEPCVLYHKVGQGTLEMYVLSPPKGSKEVKDFIQEWNSYKERFSNVKSGLKHKKHDVSIPLSHATSICALVVWRPADPKESITRILLPGSAPQNKIFESLELLKDLDILKQPTVTKMSLNSIIMAKPKSKLEKPPTKASIPNRKNTASPSLSVSSVASRNGDIGIPKKEIRKDNKEIKKDNKEVKKDNKEIKKDNKEIKKEVKKDNKEMKTAAEKKVVAKHAPKKLESSPPTAKSAEAKKPAPVKKTTAMPKKDSPKPASVTKSSEKSEVKKTSTSKATDSKTAKEITNKKVAETKTGLKAKPKSSAIAGKMSAKTEKAKASPVTKITGKVAKTAAAAAAVVAASAAAGTVAAVATTETEVQKKEEVAKVLEEVQVEAEKVEEPVEDIAKDSEQQQDQKPSKDVVPPTPPEAVSPAPSETASLTPSDTLSSAPMETVSPTPPLPEAASPGEEKEVNEVKEVDNKMLSTEQDVNKLESSGLDNEADAEQEHTLIDHSTEDTPIQVIESETNIEKDADITLGTDNIEKDADITLGTDNIEKDADITLGTDNIEKDADITLGTDNIEKDADITLGTDNKENEIATELMSATDMTSSFMEDHQESVDMMTSSFIKETDSMECAVVEVIEQSSAITTESAPSAFMEPEVEIEEHKDVTEQFSVNEDKHENELDNHLLESEVLPGSEHEQEEEIVGSSEHLPKDEIMKADESELTDEIVQGEPEVENKLKAADLAPGSGLIETCELISESKVTEDLETVLPIESEGEEIVQSSESEHVTESIKEEKQDIDSFLAGATMEGSICAGIPAHDEREFDQDDSDFNANNQMEDKVEEQEKPPESDIMDSAAEIHTDEAYIEKSVTPEISEKFDTESAAVLQNETAVDEISADSLSEHLHEKIVDDENEKYFAEKDAGDLDERLSDERNIYDVNKDFDNEKHIYVHSEEPSEDITKENNMLPEETYFDKQEIDSNLMTTSLIGEDEFGLDKESPQDEEPTQGEELTEDQKAILDERMESDFEHLKEEFVEDKFDGSIEDIQNSQMIDESCSLTRVNDFDKNELEEHREEVKEIETVVSASETVCEPEHPKNENLADQLEDIDIEIESSQSSVHEQVMDEHSFASKDLSSGNVEAEISVPHLNDGEDFSSSASAVRNNSPDITEEVVHKNDEIFDNLGIKEDESVQNEVIDDSQPDEVVRKESAVSIVLECEDSADQNDSGEKRRESYAESEDDVDINRYMVKDDVEFADPDRLQVKLPSRDSDSDDEDVVKSPTPHAIVDYEGQLDDHVLETSHETAEVPSMEQNFVVHDLNRDSDNAENYASESKQDFNEKDRDSAEDDEEMIRHPTPPGEKQFYENIGPSEEQDVDDEMKDPISQHFIPPSFRQTSDVIDDPVYEEPEGSDSERSQSPVVEQPVFGNVGEADFPELVNVSGATTPSEPQSPKLSQDSKHKNAALGVEVLDALSEHDVDCSEASLQSPLCKDEIAFDVACDVNSAIPAEEKYAVQQQDLAAPFEDVKEQINANDPDVVNEMTTSGYTLDDISSSVLSSETQYSTVVTGESFSSSIVTSEFTTNMQSSMYEQFSDDQEPVLDDICVGDEKHEQESSKEVMQETHSTVTETSGQPENLNLIEDQQGDYPDEELADIPVVAHESEKEVISGRDDDSHNKEFMEDKAGNLKFPSEDDQLQDDSCGYPDVHHDDHQAVEEKDINLQFSSNENQHLISDSHHSDFLQEDKKINESEKFPLLDSSHPNGHDVEHMPTSEHEDMGDGCLSQQLESTPFSVKDIQSNHLQETMHCDTSSPLNCSSQFSELSQSHLKVEQEYLYAENSRLHSVSPDDNIMANDSSPDVPSPAEPEMPFSHISDQKNSVQQNNFDGNENNFSHDLKAQDGFSSDNMNFGVASNSNYDGRREDPYGHSDSEDEDSSSIPGTVSPYAYTNKAYTQEEEEVDGNHIYKQSLRIEQTSEIKSLSFDGNNPQELPDDITLGSSTNTRMTYSPGFPDMSSADPNYDFRLEEWGKPMGLPTPPESGHNLVKKTTKSAALNKSLNKANDKRSSIDNGKTGSPLVGSKALSSPSKAPLKSKAPTSTSNGSPVYVDLAYVPHHGDPDYCDVEFFKKVRARYYVLSGINPSKEVLNALLEAKQSWKEDLEVTIIPTYETDTLGYWMAQNQETLTANSIEVAPSASRCTVNLQDHETRCSAYRLEF